MTDLAPSPVETSQAADFQQWEGEYVDHVLRNLEMDGEVYQTDQPEGVNVFSILGASNNIDDLIIVPSALDSLPEGSYTIARMEAAWSETGEGKVLRSRTVTVRTTDKGKIIDRASFNEGWMRPDYGIQGVCEALGFEVQEDPNEKGKYNITGVPTPITLKNAASELGVEVELMPHAGELRARDYLGVFAKGAYPVSTADDADYSHDTEDDHITIMVLGGEPLRDALKIAARNALISNDIDIQKQVTTDIDSFTADLRGSIAPHDEITGEPYSRENARANMIKNGVKLGITAETINKIIMTAQENGRSFGVQVKDIQ